MTSRPSLPPVPSRIGGRRPQVVLQDELQDPHGLGWFDPSDHAGQRPRPGRAEPDGRTARRGGDCVVDGWDDLGPEAA
jgi:hypothetical protein